jgi:hypothetical protein
MALTFADFSDDEIARAVPRVGVAFHEIGHSIACTVLGGRVFAAVVGGGKYAGALGHTEYADLPDGHRAAITYAGGGPKRGGVRAADPTCATCAACLR